MSTSGTAGLRDLEASFDYQDTVTLLQEEIARLEEELRLRDESRAEAVAAPGAEFAEHDAQSTDAVSAGRIAELTTELARRDETIALLLEEIRLFEEAEAANRSEWNQLNEWVTQVEQRVDSRDHNDSKLADDLAEERTKNEALRQAAETDRKVWETQRQDLEQEGERLRKQLAELARKKQADSDGDLALAALEGENRRLRRMCDELTRAAAAAGEVEKLRTEAGALHAQIQAAQAQVRELEDETERQGKEHAAELASLRSQLVREAHPKRGEGEPAAATLVRDLSLVTGEERMQAFRQHLQDIHQRELQERADRKLSARISRLWRKTSTTE